MGLFAPTDQVQIAPACSLSQAKQFVINSPLLLNLVPEPDAIFGDHFWAGSVFADAKGVSQATWSTDVNSFALVVTLIDDSDHCHPLLTFNST